MRVGDQMPVNMEGFHVGYAVIEEIDGDTVTMVIPQTRFVMGLKTSLTTPEPEGVEQVLEAAEKDVAEPTPPAPTRVSGGVRPEDVSNTGLHGVKLDSSAID